jgi:hypothetical protein
MKTTNKRRPYLEIPDDEINALPPEMQRVFQTLNARFRTLGELHEATAGLRGPVGIAKQSKKDQRGIDMPGLTLEGNRAANAADPIDGQDLVTLAYLKKQLSCDNLTRILEECNDFAELLDNENDNPTTTTTIPASYFWGAIVLTDYQGVISTNAVVSPADGVPVYEFFLPYDITVSQITTDVTTARSSPSKYSVGIYDAVGGSLIVDSGPLSAAATGVQATSLVTPVTLRSGIYAFAQTSNDILIQVRCWGLNLDLGILNKSYRRAGLAVNSSTGGQLPGSTGGLAAFINQRPIAAALFE